MGDAPGEASSAWSSIGFDASVHELLMPLTTGAVNSTWSPTSCAATPRR
jgi:hypothetical protein